MPHIYLNQDNTGMATWSPAKSAGDAWRLMLVDDLC